MILAGVAHVMEGACWKITLSLNDGLVEKIALETVAVIVPE